MLVHQLATEVTHWVTNTIVLAVPDPGAGTAPPGSEGIITILRWAAWLATGACVLGLLIAGASMAMAASGHGRGGAEHATRLGWVCGGCIVIGAASAIVAALI